MLFYRAALPLSRQTLSYVARIIRRHRAAIGSCWRKLNPRHAFVIIDGTLIAIDRVVKDRPFYSGKHRRHGMNLQVISAPDGETLWVSGPLPGSVHDLTAALTPYRGRGKPESQKAANRAHARLRAPGERASAQLKTWHILRKLRCRPGRPNASPRPSTSFKPERPEDEKGSVLVLAGLTFKKVTASAVPGFAAGWGGHRRPG